VYTIRHPALAIVAQLPCPCPCRWYQRWQCLLICSALWHNVTGTEPSEHKILCSALTRYGMGAEHIWCIGVGIRLGVAHPTFEGHEPGRTGSIRGKQWLKKIEEVIQTMKHSQLLLTP